MECRRTTGQDDLPVAGEVKEPLLVGDVYPQGGKTRVKVNKYGPFKVWERCKQEDAYFLTVDAAGGKKKMSETEKKTNKEPDRTNIDVWNHRTGLQAAQWNGHMPYDIIADNVQMIGEMYAIDLGRKLELPIACVELNNHGYTVAADLERMHYPQYESKKGEPGWVTNRRTKPQMIDSFQKAARDGELLINAGETVQEMRTYIEDNGEFNAASGCKDDRVMTAAVAAEIIKDLPIKFTDIRRRKLRKGSGFKNWDERTKPESHKTKVTEIY